MKHQALIALALMAAGALGTACSSSETVAEATPEWLEADSLAAINSRIACDFRLTLEEATEQIREKHPDVTDEQIAEFIAKHYIEVREIDGRTMVHYKSPRNLGLLCPEMFEDGRVPARGEHASEARVSYVDSVLAHHRGLNPLGAAHKVTYSFTVNVPWHEAIDGDTVRVWMPYPMDTSRQTEPELISTSQPDYVVAQPGQSVHRTLYMSAPAPAQGDTATFSYTATFVTRGVYNDPRDIQARLKPYDKDSELYKTYTAFDSRHIIRLDSLAQAITKGETNPLLCSEMVYDYIINKYPWAGAREYSTLECIPQYVIDEGHGDCGQVALLYISLMRTLGIPARWESGWMMHPGEKNYHDWAEVYFEGTGWVPVDVSFGRYRTASDPAAVNFYSTSMDAHRFATNCGIGGPLYPAKKFVRSETVDFQPGEVETTKGNLFYPAWNSRFKLIEIVPVEI